VSQHLPLIVLEVFLGFGVPLVWAIHELIVLRRHRERDRVIAPAATEERAADG